MSDSIHQVMPARASAPRSTVTGSAHAGLAFPATATSKGRSPGRPARRSAATVPATSSGVSARPPGLGKMPSQAAARRMTAER